MVKKNHNIYSDKAPKLAKSSINYRKNKLYRYEFDNDVFHELTISSTSEYNLLKILITIGRNMPISSTNITKKFGSKYSYEILKKLYPTESHDMHLCDWNELDAKMGSEKKLELYNLLDKIFGLHWFDVTTTDEAKFLDVSQSKGERIVTISYGYTHKLNIQLDSKEKATLMVFKKGNECTKHNLKIKKIGKKIKLYIKVAHNPILCQRRFVRLVSKNSRIYYELNVRGLLLLLALNKFSRNKTNLYPNLESVLLNLENSEEMQFLNWHNFKKFDFDIIRILVEIAESLYKLVIDINMTENNLLYLATVLYLGKIKQYFYWTIDGLPNEYYEYRDSMLKKLGEFHQREYDGISKELEGPSSLHRSYEPIVSS